MLFDTPQWPILPAYEVREFGRVHNVVSVCPNGKDVYFVTIVVPTALIHLLSDRYGVGADSPLVRLFLDGESARAPWYLNMQFGDDVNTVDLWRYPSLPAWAETRYKLKK